MRRRWRLILDGAASGPWNMGLDEALLESACAGGPPTLRLYRWSGPWLSLGRAQPLDPAREAACRAAGVGVVRRATGGRAVLHGGDLTYAVAAPDPELPGGLAASYAIVCEALLAALRVLGVEAEAAAREPSRAERPGFDCFAVPAEREVCVRGRKLAGSAQRRTRGGVLQHGSIRVLADPAAATAACGLRAEAATQLCDELPIKADFDVISKACVMGFEQALKASFEPAEPTTAEREAAERRRFD